MLYKKILAFSAAAAMALSMTACGGGASDKPTSDSTAKTEDDAGGEDAGDAGDSADAGAEASGDTIVIGGIGPLTGQVSVYGESALNGAKLYLDEKGEVLGKKIEFLMQDDKGDVQEAISQYNKLVDNQNAVAIIGPVTSKPSDAVATEAEQTGMPMITPSATAAEVTNHGDSIFRTCYLDPFQGETMANFAFDNLGFKNVAVLYDQADDYSEGVADAFIANIESKEGVTVNKEAYTTGDKDFRAQLTKLQATEPEALFLPVYYEDVALIASQAKDVGLETQLLGVDGWDGVLNVLDDASVVDGAYFCNHYSQDDETPKVQEFITKYKEAYGADPTAFAALGYDSAKIMIAAIEEAGSTDSAAIVEALKGISVDSVTATGDISFDEDGNPLKGVSIITIKDGKNTLYEKMD